MRRHGVIGGPKQKVSPPKTKVPFPKETIINNPVDASDIPKAIIVSHKDDVLVRTLAEEPVPVEIEEPIEIIKLDPPAPEELEALFILEGKFTKDSKVDDAFSSIKKKRKKRKYNKKSNLL